MIVFMSFLIWKKCLFEKYGAFLPIDKSLDQQQINKRKIFMSTKTYSVLTALFLPLLNSLEMDYWCTHTGVDGYLYLLFQRRFYTLTKYMVIISMLSQCILYMIDPNFEFSIFGDKSLENSQYLSD